MDRATVTQSQFQQRLVVGQLGESAIARWLKRNGYNIMPVYEKEVSQGKGPQVFMADGRQLVAPDLFAFKAGESGSALWIEAKHKSVFSWHRITERWVTGIDLRHYSDYLRVADSSPWRVILMFLHREARTNEWPYNCPSGLFGNDLKVLRTTENHRHANWGKSGMVYWAETSLKKFATVEEVFGAEKKSVN